ncbi:hypothetical protein D3C72_957460 [compost metagenome]
MQGPARRLAQGGDDGSHVVHGLVVDGENLVVFLQAGARGGALRHDFHQRGRGTGQGQAQLAQHVAFQVRLRQAGRRQRRFLLATVWTAHFDARRLLVERGLDHFPAQLGPAGHGLAVDCFNGIAAAQAGRIGGSLFGHGAKLARRLFDAIHEQARVQHDGDEEIGQRAGGHDGDAAPHALAREFAAQFAFRQVAEVLRAAVEHADITAQRQRGNRPFRLVFAKLARIHHFSHADRETQHLHAAPARHQVVAQLMQGNQ